MPEFDSWRASENTIGSMVNPTSLSDAAFAGECYRYLLATDRGEAFGADWLDEPRLWPKTITRYADLVALRRAIPSILPTQRVVYAARVLGGDSFIARWVEGLRWNELDWRTPEGTPVGIRPAIDSVVGTVITWRLFLDEDFLRHPVPFALTPTGRRVDGDTVGLLRPASIVITDIEHTGRTGWATGERADVWIPGAGWDRTLAEIALASGDELDAAGISPRSARAWRNGRKPTKRNADAARRFAERHALGHARLRRANLRHCLAPACEEALNGRQRSFCPRHARFPGARRKAWREASQS